MIQLRAGCALLLRLQVEDAVDALVARLPGRRRRLAGRSGPAASVGWLCLLGARFFKGMQLLPSTSAAGHGLPYDLPYDLDGEAGGAGGAPDFIRPAPARGAYSVLPAAEPPASRPQPPQ